MDVEVVVRPDQPCGFENCDSIRYHVNDSGFFECQNGHVHYEMRVEDAEDEDAAYGAAERGQKSRTGTASETSEKMSKVLLHHHQC